jgi:universal stress protein E
MAQSKSILVVIDPTAEAQPALERGAWLARKLHASVELFICDYDQYLSGERFFDGRSLEKARKQVIAKDAAKLHKLAQQLGDDVPVSVDARWDHPLHEGIVRKVLACKPDFVVKDTHYHSALKRSIFSNTDWNLARECPAPLWLVKPRPIRTPATLLAAVDPVHEHDKPAELDHRILDAARELAAAIGGARLHVLHAFDPAPAYAISSDSMAFPISAPMTDIMDALKKTHEGAMRDLMQSYPEIPKNDVHIEEGNVRERLDALVDEIGADLVIMGAVARGALERLLLGSTAEQVLDRVACDILIVKPSGFPSRVAV